MRITKIVREDGHTKLHGDEKGEKFILFFANKLLDNKQIKAKEFAPDITVKLTAELSESAANRMFSLYYASNLEERIAAELESCKVIPISNTEYENIFYQEIVLSGEPVLIVSKKSFKTKLEALGLTDIKPVKVSSLSVNVYVGNIYFYSIEDAVVSEHSRSVKNIYVLA